MDMRADLRPELDAVMMEGTLRMIDNTADILSSLSARSLLEATDQPCLVATATDRRIVWANEAAGALFDRPAAELTDRSLLSVHPAGRKAYRRALATEGKSSDCRTDHPFRSSVVTAASG
ncbi:PAS domain-containing protein [Natrialba swarupiae]|nr:PAS domain-containing protein [Natrialba swarupiae]